MPKPKPPITERQQQWLDHINAADASEGSLVAYAAAHCPASRQGRRSSRWPYRQSPYHAQRLLVIEIIEQGAAACD